MTNLSFHVIPFNIAHANKYYMMDVFQAAITKIQDEIIAKGSPKRMMVKTLLNLFGFKNRSQEGTQKITSALGERGILVNPSLIRFGDLWEQKTSDWVYLSIEGVIPTNSSKELIKPHFNWKKDDWFDQLHIQNYRTEKEVENKFILPLLSRLGFGDADRYDGMIINAAQGSRQITLEVDFALFNADSELLKNQTLLVAEAKKEQRLQKQVELENAQRQVKSYSLWLSCHFGLVTDSKRIQVLDLIPSFDGIKVLFDCQKENLKDRFEELYAIASKSALTGYYTSKIQQLIGQES